MSVRNRNDPLRIWQDGSPSSPEQRLLTAVIAIAIQDAEQASERIPVLYERIRQRRGQSRLAVEYRASVGRQIVRAERRRDEAIAWLMRGVWCERYLIELGIDPEAFRQQLRRTRGWR